jgi:hypothetical protein
MKDPEPGPLRQAVPKFLTLQTCVELGMAVYICNCSTQETEARGSPVSGQPGLHSEILSQNETNTKQRKKLKKYILFIVLSHSLFQVCVTQQQVTITPLNLTTES